MGEGKFTPLTTPTPLNRQSPNIAHVITSSISPHNPHLVKIAPAVTSSHIAKVTTQFFYISFCVRKIFLPTYSSGRWTDFDMRYINRDAYQHRVVPFGGQKTIFSHLPLKTPQNPIFGHIQCKIHIGITAWSTEIRRWNLAHCLTLPSTLSTHKIFSVRGIAGGLVTPTLNIKIQSLSQKLMEPESWHLIHW